MTHLDSRRSGWLVAPLLFMVALGAHAQDSTPPQGITQAQSKTQVQSKNQGKTPVQSKTRAQRILLAQNNTQTVQQTNQPAQRQQLQEVVVTGSGECLEVWDRGRHKANLEELLNEIPDLTASLGHTA